jgi:hypothetical protein
VMYPWAYLGRGGAASSMLTEQEIKGKQVDNKSGIALAFLALFVEL